MPEVALGGERVVAELARDAGDPLVARGDDAALAGW